MHIVHWHWHHHHLPRHQFLGNLRYFPSLKLLCTAHCGPWCNPLIDPLSHHFWWPRYIVMSAMTSDMISLPRSSSSNWRTFTIWSLCVFFFFLKFVSSGCDTSLGTVPGYPSAGIDSTFVTRNPLVTVDQSHANCKPHVAICQLFYRRASYQDGRFVYVRCRSWPVVSSCPASISRRPRGDSGKATPRSSLRPF